jgi:hypothetical protein
MIRSNSCQYNRETTHKNSIFLPKGRVFELSLKYFDACTKGAKRGRDFDDFGGELFMGHSGGEAREITLR